jgi:hypothetical protein
MNDVTTTEAHTEMQAELSSQLHVQHSREKLRNRRLSGSPCNE